MNLFNHLPPLYSENEDMKKLQDIVSRDLGTLINNLNLMINQNFIDTATIRLTEIEKVFDLNTDVSKSNEFRRERIKAKIRGQGTTTKALIESVASSFSGGEVEVIEDNANNKFTIKFIGQLGIPANMEDLELSIEEIKPAHLIFDFKYSYRTHKTLSTYTHSQLASFSHDELREGEI